MENISRGPAVDIRAFAPLDTLRDGSVDWQPYIQAAVGYIVEKSVGDAGLLGTLGQVGTLYLPPGRYRIDAPIQIARVKDGEFDFVSIEIVGDAAPFGAGFHAASIEASFNDRPAVLVQGGRAVRLRRLSIRGRNTWESPEKVSSYYDDATFVVNGCRDNRYSPYAGICIDPYHALVPDGDRYPGLGPGYRRKIYGGSSDVVIDDCHVEGFVTGIAISPTGHLQNAENIRISNTSVYLTKSSIAVCQDQSRNVALDNVVLSASKYAINAVDYGRGTGNCPSIFGANVGHVKAIFHVTSAGAAPCVNGLYSESILSIGQLFGGQALDGYVFQGCSFTFFNTPAGRRSVNAHLTNLALATFVGCQFVTAESDAEPLRFHNAAGLVFQHCHFGSNAPDTAPIFYFTGRQDRVKFENCFVQDRLQGGDPRDGASTKTVFSHVLPVDHLPNFTGHQALPGTLFYPVGGAGGLRWVAGPFRRVPLGNAAVTVDERAATATFSVADPSILQVGDLIWSSREYLALDPPADHVPITVVTGKVRSISGSTITLAYVPFAVASGESVPLYLVYFPRVHVPTQGSWEAGATVITGVTQPAAWRAGQRVRGAGIPDGAYITGISGHTFTLSTATTAKADKARLYDADVHAVSTTPL